MMDIEKMLTESPFALDSVEKKLMLSEKLIKLTHHHYNNCELYRNMMDFMNFKVEQLCAYDEIPYLPVRLFKMLDLMSIDRFDIFKIMMSSGTTGQAVSKIYLDKETAAMQQKVLVKIVTDFTGNSRMPMLVIDSKSTLKNRNEFSARAAGILGFSIFGSNITYALDDQMNIDIEAVSDFLVKYKDRKILIFGFTFMIWENFYKGLKELQKNGITFDLSNGILIHGGGWKKLSNQNISNDTFKKEAFEICHILNIHDYYGMVEQTGCIYMECQEGHLHASIFSDVIIRNKEDLSIAPNGEVGLIQVLSVIPHSYCGHSLLTEDEGVIIGEDDCKCGRKGKYFKVLGRLQNAEIRGCSDTYASEY